MKITIQATFPGGEEARLAASSLAMAQGGGLAMSISTHQPGQGISYKAPFAAALSHQTPSASGGVMVTVVCDETQEAFVMGELAALGARRVVQQNDQ